MILTVEIYTYLLKKFRFLLTNRTDLVKSFEEKSFGAITVFEVELIGDNPMTAYKLGREWQKILSHL